MKFFKYFLNCISLLFWVIMSHLRLNMRKLNNGSHKFTSLSKLMFFDNHLTIAWSNMILKFQFKKNISFTEFHLTKLLACKAVLSGYSINPPIFLAAKCCLWVMQWMWKMWLATDFIMQINPFSFPVMAAALSDAMLIKLVDGIFLLFKYCITSLIYLLQ